MSRSAVPAPLRRARFPCGYKMKRADTQSTTLPDRAGVLLSAGVWHRRAPKLKAAGELSARRFAQSIPLPYGRFGCVRFDAKPSSGIAVLRRGTACIKHHHRASLLPPSQAGASALESAEEASAAGRPHASAWGCASAWHGRHRGPPHPGRPARDGLARVSNWGGKNKGGVKGEQKKFISFQPQRAKRESRGGEREAASALQSRSDPRGME